MSSPDTKEEEALVTRIPQPAARQSRRGNAAPILDAALDEMEASGPEGSRSGVAERSDIALRTIYRHFPNRDALVDDAALLRALRLDSACLAPTRCPPPPSAAAFGGANLRLLEAALRCPRQIALRERTRPGRMAQIEKILAPEVEGLSLAPAGASSGSCIRWRHRPSGTSSTSRGARTAAKRVRPRPGRCAAHELRRDPHGA
jgi:AcrR family transcriptional regulator